MGKQAKQAAKGRRTKGKGGKPGAQAHAQAKTKAPSPAAKATEATPAIAISPALWMLGGVLLLVSGAASLMLVLQSLGNLSLIGCGAQSACARATASIWGKVPGLGWPTSHVGLAYFLAMLLAWLTTRGRLAPSLRWLIRLSAIVSLGLITVMAVGGYLCPYCLAVHLASLAFVGLVEWTSKGAIPTPATAGGDGRALRGLPELAGMFVLATVVLVVAQGRTSKAVAERDEADLAESTERILDGARQEPLAVVDAAPTATDVPFTGRYRLGPEVAPIRLVVISDYQCPDCNTVEDQLREIIEERTDIGDMSFSAKHFPFCTDCNWKARQHNLNLHRNACWAARAAETAGIIDGNDGFWRMHYWLFDVDGSFTNAELRAALPELGFDYDEFAQVMGGPEVDALIEEDINEAVDLGLRQTPMIFINGEELIGWRTPNALRSTIEALAATNPPARSAEADKPPRALEKHLGAWQKAHVRAMPSDGSDWSAGFGPGDAAVEVVIWGDYLEPYTAELDARVRGVVDRAEDVRYSFRAFPFDRTCNPTLQGDRQHDGACLASSAAEAAGRVGGVDAYWRMHIWLMQNGERVKAGGRDALRAAAGELDIDADAFVEMLDSPEVAAAIKEDIDAARSQGLRGIPFFFVNGKLVPFWRLEKQPLVERIIDAARARPEG